MTEFLTEGGKKVTIAAAPFGDAIALKNAIQKAILEQKLDVSGIDISDFSKLKTDSINIILNAIMAVDSNSEVEKILFQCLARCSYGPNKINRETFEDLEARGAYYQILLECLKANLLPFFAPLFSKLKKLEEKVQVENQK